MSILLRLSFILCTISIGVALYAQKNIDQPKYNIIKTSDKVELRQYAPQIVAQVSVKAKTMREASSRGFRPLAGYIFGNNQGANQIAMTAPVTTQQKPDGTKIAMTAPVTSFANGDSEFIIRFSMPRKWTMETLPVPNDDNVKIISLEPEKRVIYPMVGYRTEARLNEAKAKIAKFMEKENLKALSPIIIAGYDGPRVSPSQRRWELMQIVK